MSQFGLIGETFETSVPWDRIEEMCAAVERALAAEVRGARRSRHAVSLLSRDADLSRRRLRLLHDGVFRPRSRRPGRRLPRRSSSVLRQVILDHGGSLSHHHGVGKIRQRFLPQVHTAAGLELIRAAKRAVDPGNVFGIGNGACGGGPPREVPAAGLEQPAPSQAADGLHAAVDPRRVHAVRRADGDPRGLQRRHHCHRRGTAGDARQGLDDQRAAAPLPRADRRGAWRRRRHARQLVRRHLPGPAERLRQTRRRPRELAARPPGVRRAARPEAGVARRSHGRDGRRRDRAAVRLEHRRSRAAARRPSTAGPTGGRGSSPSTRSTTRQKGTPTRRSSSSTTST